MQISWKKFYLREKKWKKLVTQETRNREDTQIENPIKIYILIALLIFLPTKIKTKKITLILINLQNHPIRHELAKNYNTIHSNNTVKSILSRKSLIELDLLHILTNKIYIGKYTRKILIRITKYRISNTINRIYKTAIFITNEDYTPKPSTITTISEQLSEIKIIGLQHGIMDPETIKKSEIYPGIRSRIEIALTENYKKIMETKKPKNTIIITSDESFYTDSKIKEKEPSGKKRIIFISSNDLSKQETIRFLKKIKIIAKIKGYELYLRPHPKEANTKYKEFKIDKSNKSDLLSLSKNETIFIGYFSTLLYESYAQGHTQLWIARNNLEKSKIEHLEIKNSLIIEEKINYEELNEIITNAEDNKANIEQNRHKRKSDKSVSEIIKSLYQGNE